jgi:hypothetical protein
MAGATDQERPETLNEGRMESIAQRDDRNLLELLQELRVASIGVQVLFGFLLSLPFSTRFHELDHAQRGLYIADVLLAALSTALLASPVAYHRLTFRRHLKGRLIRWANVIAICGLVTVSLAICLAVMLVTSYVLNRVVVPLIAAGTFGSFAALWFVLPLVARHGAPRLDQGLADPEPSGSRRAASPGTS